MSGRLDKILDQAVFSPWRDACENATHPWRATPKLKADWAGMMRSGDPDTSLAGGLGLARVSLQDESEFEIVENYFNNFNDINISPDTLAMVLLSGASPPHLFMQSFLTLCLLDKEGWCDSFYWSLFSSYIRHPHSSKLPLSAMFQDGNSGKIQYLLKCNPLVAIGERSGGGNWDSALRCFRDQLTKDGSGFRTEIATLAKSIRADTDPRTLSKIIDTLCLDGVMESRLKKHPVIIRQSVVGEIDHSDPSSSSIAFFSGADDVSRIWRFYNPLLLHPWMMEKIDEDTNPLLYLGKLLCGMIPVPSYSGTEKATVNRISAGHPFLVLDFEGG